MHLYTPHKVALLQRARELKQAANRLLKQLKEEQSFMRDPKVKLEDVFEHEVKLAGETSIASCDRLIQYIDSVPDDPNEV